MSLYGALYTGVSGLNAQGQKIGIISDNIANANTIGYKESKASFESLVVNAATTSTYSPGGVRSNTVQNIDKQGILSSTSSPTDLAISGQGFFVVSARPDGLGGALYTRAGNFTQDSLGNFKNANGFYLQGWPLDSEGRLPGEYGNTNSVSSANLESLEVVNVSSASGKALTTSKVSLGINLNAGESVYAGPQAIVDMDSNNNNNYKISSTAIIVPNEYALASANHIVRGDKFTAVLGNGTTYDYEYGGFSIGRRIEVTGPTNIGDGATDLTPITIPISAMTTDGPAATTITVDLATLGYTPAEVAAYTASLSAGDQFQLSGMNGFDGIPTSALNRVQTISAVDTVAGTITFDVGAFAPAGATAGSVGNAAGGGFTFRIFQGNILDATSASGAFLGSTGTSNYTTGALSFIISTPSTGTHTFTYTAGSPSALLGQFNSLSNLAQAISQSNGLTARVVDGRLVVGSTDANESVVFSNVDDAGSATLQGIDWVGELGVKDVVAGTRRFSSMASLAGLVNADDGLSASIDNPLGDSTLTLAGTDPLSTVRFTDFATKPQPLVASAVGIPGAAAGVTQTATINIVGHGLVVGDHVTLAGLTAANGFTTAELNKTYTIASVVDADHFTVAITAAGATTAFTSTAGTWAKGNTGSILGELGLVESLAGATYVPGDTGVLGPEYDASGASGQNMASGEIAAQYSRTSRVYDSLGTGHDIRFSYLKIEGNKWAVEIHSDPTAITSTLVDGQIAVGTIEFNGDGTLRSVTNSLLNPATINWTNGSAPSKISFDFGTAGQAAGTIGATTIGGTDGLSQFDSAYNVNFLTQNGAPVGELTSVAIDPEGYVIASYSNGQTQRIYKLPIADFNNPNGLKAETGNVFTQTRDSGEVNLREAGTNGTGTVVSGSLEQSNVDLATELTDMIVAQRSYQANSKVIKTADELLEQLNQL